MRGPLKLAATALVTTFTLAPALALAGPPANTGRPSSPGKSGQHAHPTPGPKAPLPAKAKAYGVRCRGESKQHVKGLKGTPFSVCVTDMAKLATGKRTNPARACKGEPKKHIAGQKGTPYSICVSGGAKLLKDRSSSS